MQTGTINRSKGSVSGKIENTQINSEVGGVAEWLKAPVLKTGGGVSRPWVRIPPPPPKKRIPRRISRGQGFQLRI